MLVILLGVLLGGVLAFAGVATVPADRLDNAATRVVAKSGERVLSALPSAVAHNRALAALIILLAVAVPGLLAWLLASLARGAKRLRSLMLPLAVVIGAASFAVLPAREAGVLLAGLVILAGIARLATGWLLTLPLAAAATALGLRQLFRVVAGSDPQLTAAARQLGQLAGTPHELWRVVATVIALLPLVPAALRLLGRSGKVH
ncbi:MAG: hypothetical protein ACYDAQ_14975 [Mycobacteriales bacterium]